MSSAVSSMPAKFRNNVKALQDQDRTIDWRHSRLASDDTTAVGDLEFDEEDYVEGAVHTLKPQRWIPRRPLIDACTNDWKTNPKYSSNLSSPERDDNSLIYLCCSILKGPRFRRYVLIYVLLFTIVVSSWKGLIQPRWHEHQQLVSALNEGLRLNRGGWFGTNARPHFANMIQLKTLDKELLPGAKVSKRSGKSPRLVFVGDVHGCKDELVKLLEKVSFDPHSDHLILTGDIIAKGPQSRGVIDLARKMGASCVRGNHEDRVLLVHSDLNSNIFTKKAEGKSRSSSEDSVDEEGLSRGIYSDRALARKLSPDQVEWLESCPVILRVGDIKGVGEVVVVHAGLVPGVELEKQDPSSVMNMRTIDLETHVPSKQRDGMPWSKLWNKHQHLLAPKKKSADSENKKDSVKHTTVIYGHDAKRGLQIKKYSKGLDTGCITGGRLTALVMSEGGEQKLYSVKCKDHRSAKSVKVDVENVIDGTKKDKRDSGDD